MGSFDTVNYSVRPSKSIQRSLVFDDVRRLQDISKFDQKELLYVGFGSIWFVDFQLAHRVLGASDLISVEANPIGFERAQFNKPFSCVSVERGYSGAVLPKLYNRPNLTSRPWMMWLDYDYEFNESVKSDVQEALERLPANSIFLITFNTVGSRYGRMPRDREYRIRDLFGDAVPATVTRSQLDGENFSHLLKSCAMNYMKSVVYDLARPGGFVPAFAIAYKDQAPMVTVGGILPTSEALGEVSAACTSAGWKCVPDHFLTVPHLTSKESAVLQAQLPSGILDRDAVKALGFDLEEAQLEAFKRYYLFYPNYAQVVS